MALQSRSSGCHCQTDDTMTEDTWSVTTEAVSMPASLVARRLVLRAFTYLHVQNQDTGVTRMVAGPCSFSPRGSESVTLEPQSMVVVPSAHHCLIDSPVLRADGLVAYDEVGQARLRHGEREVRLHQPPFPLYPGESLAGAVMPLPVVGANQALRLRAVQNTTDDEGTQRKAGEEWLFGPGTYTPRPEVMEVGRVDAAIVGENQALRLRAVRDTVDNEGTKRKAGEEWLVTNNGAYIPAVREEVVGVVQLELITLTNRQYCVVGSPVVGDKPQRKILRGPKSFFLLPGEALENGIRDVCFIEANEALDLVAREAFTDETVTPAVSRGLGDRWTVRGPAAVTPPAEAEVLRQHSAIPLGANEGVYVQNTVTGEVRVEMGKSYLLKAEERLWSKELPSDAERLLAEYRGDAGSDASKRDKNRVVTYCVLDDRFALVENHGTGESREVRGPELIKLLPEEQFRVYSLPGGTPIFPNHSLSLTLPWLGESHHLTDLITVMTDRQVLRALTIKIGWKLSYPLTGTVAKNGVDEAFLQLRQRLIADAGKSGIRGLYEIGEFRFEASLMSDTKPFNKD